MPKREVQQEEFIEHLRKLLNSETDEPCIIEFQHQEPTMQVSAAEGEILTGKDDWFSYSRSQYSDKMVDFWAKHQGSSLRDIDKEIELIKNLAKTKTNIHYFIGAMRKMSLYF